MILISCSPPAPPYIPYRRLKPILTLPCVSPRTNTGKVSDPKESSGWVFAVSCLSLFLFSLFFLDSQSLFPLAGSLQSRAVDWQNIGHYGNDEGRSHPEAGPLSPLACLMHVSYLSSLQPTHSSPPTPKPKLHPEAIFPLSGPGCDCPGAQAKAP